MARDLSLWWLGFSHDGEKPYSVMILAMERASSHEVKNNVSSGVILCVIKLYQLGLLVLPKLKVEVFIDTLWV